LRHEPLSVARRGPASSSAQPGAGQTIVIATDTWQPQVNGVVRQLQKTIAMLERWEYRVEVIHPYLFGTYRLPGFNDLEFTTGRNRLRINAMLRKRLPCAIHVASEGPLGLAVSRFCKGRGLPFTTWHHTDYPATLPATIPLPDWFIYAYMRWFHKCSSTIMVNTRRMGEKLRENGFQAPMRVWSGGVDTDLFRPRPKPPRCRKVALYVGRIAKEKGLEQFLDCRGEYDQVLVGDGAHRAELQQRYPRAMFLGVLSGEELAKVYAAADVFVFPSMTDTFGLVLIEALACGVPVAAYPVQGPADIVDREGVGCLDHNLELAIERALHQHDPARCRQLAMEYSWESSTRMFVDNLAFAPATAPGASSWRLDRGHTAADPPHFVSGGSISGNTSRSRRGPIRFLSPGR
jgi:glycosyltransferase involved in cell wall biosynthesis